MRIERAGQVVFEGATSTAVMQRSFVELVDWLSGPWTFRRVSYSSPARVSCRPATSLFTRGTASWWTSRRSASQQSRHGGRPLTGAGAEQEGSSRSGSAVGNDHAGFSLKPHVVDYVRQLGHEVIDVGTTDDTPVDFPVMTRRVTDLVIRAEADRGILVCGTGVGAAIAANKVPGVRSAVIHDHVARQGVEHDDVNVACLGAWVVGVRIADEVVSSFFDARSTPTPTSGGASSSCARWSWRPRPPGVRTKIGPTRIAERRTPAGGERRRHRNRAGRRAAARRPAAARRRHARRIEREHPRPR